ncbi:MAG: FkbM family methyltransferase, partial [Candidatus Nezhaarchaeota archaeon]|nr:FkbM family methyltransferase [Candidatus Nezhaarchaeota archaeon]
LKNIKLNGLKNVIALNIAAWNGECNLKLFIGDVSGHHSAKKDFGLGSITVKAMPLDDVVRDLRVKRVDLIKIDVEGAELEVLEGLVRTLKEHHPKVIVEVWRLETFNELVSRLGCRAQALTLEFPYYYLLEYGNP